MQGYLENHPLPDDGTDYINMIANAGHGKCLEAIYRIFFERKDPKKNLVWLYGAPNSGKTTLIKHLETIFCTQEFNFQDKYCTTRDPSKTDQEVQLAISKEFEVDYAFSNANYTCLKQLCEGLGAMVSNNKFVEYKQ
jgi:uridine kinase